MSWETPATIGAWLGCLAFVVFLYNQLALARRNVFGQNGYVKQAECRLTHEQSLGAVQRVERRVDQIESKFDQTVRGLHRRINRLLAGQYLIAGKLGVVLEDPRLDTMMEQISREEESNHD
jgi:hypothetical protein